MTPRARKRQPEIRRAAPSEYLHALVRAMAIDAARKSQEISQ